MMNTAISRRQFFARTSTAFAALALPAWAAAASATGVGRLILNDDQWRKRLTPPQFDVLRRAGTERPYSSPLLNEHRVGVFTCIACHLALFDSKTKFDSHTGWPSFYRVRHGAVTEITDRSLPGEARTEIRCARCEGHLGHVFSDGPPPTGLRYCMNGVALGFTAA